MKREILLKFEGAISQDTLVALAENVKNKLSQRGLNPVIIKKVFAIFIELAQNVYHHSGEKTIFKKSGKRVGRGSIVIKETAEFYLIETKNLIENNKIQSLGEHCDYINSLDQEGLKQLYKEQLKKPRIPDKAGAGVGLIETARKSGYLLRYEFKPVNDLYSYFFLSVRVKKE